MADAKETGRRETDGVESKKKPTSKPTLKWNFFKLREIKSGIVCFHDGVHSSVQRLNEELLKILKLLGSEYEKFYT